VSFLGRIWETKCDSCAHTVLQGENGETVLSPDQSNGLQFAGQGPRE
jgi:hypothetical protein